jgi:hypothetical protein
MRHFAKWSECGTVSSDECLFIFLSDVLTNSIACNSGSWLDFREFGKRLRSFLSSIRKCIRLKKRVQLMKLPARSQTRRVELYSIESQNQVDFCYLICFSFMTAILKKQIQKECDLRNRALPPCVMLLAFVSDCTGDSNTALMKRPWDIATNIRRSAEIITSRLGQATISNLRGRIGESNCTKGCM